MESPSSPCSHTLPFHPPLPGFGTTYYTKPLAYRQVYVNYYKDPNFLANIWDQTVALAATQPLAAAQVLSAPALPHDKVVGLKGRVLAVGRMHASAAGHVWFRQRTNL